MLGIECIVDTDRYRIHEPMSEQTQTQVSAWATELKDNGVCVLEGFLRPEALQNCIEVANECSPYAFWNQITGNAYLDEIDLTLPARHPRRFIDRTSLSVVAYDQIPTESALTKLYHSQMMTEFVGGIIGRGPLFHYGCPLGALNISVMHAGDFLRWHFDQSDFVVSISLQDAQDGGKFEYVRNLRSQDDERYDEVDMVLKGRRDRVKTLHSPPGSLVLFEGRNTLHRVTQIVGETPRFVALLSYDTKANTNSTEYLKMIRYGRTA